MVKFLLSGYSNQTEVSLSTFYRLSWNARKKRRLPFWLSLAWHVFPKSVEETFDCLMCWKSHLGVFCLKSILEFSEIQGKRGLSQVFSFEWLLLNFSSGVGNIRFVYFKSVRTVWNTVFSIHTSPVCLYVSSMIIY